MKNFQLTLLLMMMAFSFLSCKTTEEKRKERLVDDLSSKMEESKQTIENSNRVSMENQVKIKEMDDQLVQLSSDLELLKSDQIEKNNEKMKLLEEEISSLKNELKSQGDYIKEVLETLKKMNSAPPKSASNVKKNGVKNSKDSFDDAYALYQKKEYTKSYPVLQNLLESGKLNAVQTNKILHALGIIEYSKKKYEESVTYLSRVITKYPKSSLAASSFLYIGKSLQKMGKKDEANEAYKTIVESYPDSSEAKKAKEYLKK